MKQWKLVLLMLGFWLVVVLYIGRSMPSSIDQSAVRTEQSLSKALAELSTLQQQNKELKKMMDSLKRDTAPQDDHVKDLERRLVKAKLDLERISTGNTRESSNFALTLPGEKARRRAENTAKELWYFLNAQIAKMKAGFSDQSKYKQLLMQLEGYHRTMEDDFMRMRRANWGDEWRLSKSLELGDLVQRRFEYLQNPADCGTAKKVLCNLHKGCGFGCQLHHITYCMIAAYALDRTLVLDSKGWRYSAKGWTSVFQPLSNNCTSQGSGQKHSWLSSRKTMDSFKLLELPIVDSLHPRPDFMPQAVPADLAEELATFHGDPGVWWIGQIIKYLFRPNDKMRADIEDSSLRMGFKNTIVGVHVRRTDKINLEAAFHSLDEYMKHVEEYFTQLERTQPVTTRRVYLASDDPSVLTKAKNDYPNYKFISDNLISKSASLGTRYTDSSLRGIILDIYFLSRCDFLVCTFSSQVCRVAYELMQTLHGDASQKFKSLDDVFYYGGQNAHDMRVLEEHASDGDGVMSLKVGDTIGIAGNHWDGFSKGTNRRNGQSGLYPSYKVENTVVGVAMPTYPKVPRKKQS